MANSYDNIKKYAKTFIGFDEVSDDVYDSIGSSAATVYNNAPRVAGWNGEGYAIQLNGSNQYILFTATILNTGLKSIRFKVKTTVGRRIIGEEISSGTQIPAVTIQVSPDGTLLWRESAGTTSDVYFAINSVKTVNDGEWHDVLLTISDEANDNVKIYIDDMAIPDSTYTFSVPITTTGRRTIIGANKNGSSLSDYFSGQLDQLEIYDRVISGISDKYLVLHNNEYKYHDGTAWQVTTATEENFKLFGMEQLSQITEVQWQELTGDISVVMWSDFEDKEYINVVLERDEFTPKDLLGEEYTVVVMNDEDVETQQLFLDAVGQSQEVFPLSDISLFGIREITSLTATGSGSGKIAISVDSGATWNTFGGNSWSSITNVSQGMDFATFSSLTDAQLKALLGESKFIRFAYYLTGDTEFTNVLMKVKTEGTPEFANKDDYTMSYDLLTQTITYEINKSGHFIINYNNSQ